MKLCTLIQLLEKCQINDDQEVVIMDERIDMTCQLVVDEIDPMSVIIDTGDNMKVKILSRGVAKGVVKDG